jgi:uncharacterized membrane protein
MGTPSLKQVRDFMVSSLIAGVLVVVPVYLTVLLLLKAMQTVGGVVQPLAALIPTWLPAERLLSLLLVLIVCMAVGVSLRTHAGQVALDRIQKSLFERLPGYALVHSLTQQLAGRRDEKMWKPALAEIEEALVPAFIIEELPDGSSTVFVPSSPTPLAGTVYILTPDRVHPVDVPFTQALLAISRWGYGSKDLVAAMNSPVLSTVGRPERGPSQPRAPDGPDDRP